MSKLSNNEVLFFSGDDRYVWRRVFCGFFTVSITKWDGWKKQGEHLLIHWTIFLVSNCLFFLYGLFAHLEFPVFAPLFVAISALVSIAAAFVIETIDGFKKLANDGRPAEGFNMFPDLLIRVLPGAVVLLIVWLI